MPKYRIVSDSLPFSFSCGNSTNSDLQAKHHLSVFAFTPSSYTLQKLVKREWHDVCRRDIATGCIETPEGYVYAPDGKMVDAPLGVPLAPAPNAPPVVHNEPIPGTGGPPAQAPVAPTQTALFQGPLPPTRAPVAPLPPAIPKLSAVDVQEPPPWESSNISSDEPMGEREIDNGSPEPAPATRKARSRKAVAQEVSDEPF